VKRAASIARSNVASALLRAPVSSAHRGAWQRMTAHDGA
jgi:hypothetical protein